MADRLEIVSAERIRDEFSKLMQATSPSIALTGLVEPDSPPTSFPRCRPWR